VLVNTSKYLLPKNTIAAMEADLKLKHLSMEKLGEDRGVPTAELPKHHAYKAGSCCRLPRRWNLVD